MAVYSRFDVHMLQLVRTQYTGLRAGISKVSRPFTDLSTGGYFSYTWSLSAREAIPIWSRVLFHDSVIVSVSCVLLARLLSLFHGPRTWCAICNGADETLKRGEEVWRNVCVSLLPLCSVLAFIYPCLEAVCHCVNTRDKEWGGFFRTQMVTIQWYMPRVG